MAGLRALITGFAAWVGGGLCFMAAAEPPPLEAYGANPELQEITISPDGDRYGLFRNIDGTPYLQVIDAQGNSVALMDASNVRARGSYFANNDAMVLFASQRERIFGYRGDFEYSAAMGFIIEKKKAYQLLKRTDLYPAQSGLGRIVGMSADGQYAYMPAYENQTNPRKSLYYTKLDSEKALLAERGTSNTVDWFVDVNGETLLREDYDRENGSYEIFVYQDGKPRSLYAVENQIPLTSGVIGLAPDGRHLVYYRGSGEGPKSGYFLMSLADGTIGQEVFAERDSSIAYTLKTRNRVVLGAAFSGMRPSYEILEPTLNSKVEALMRAFEGTSVHIESWTPDFSKIVVRAEGGVVVDDFFIFDTNVMEAAYLGTRRPDISPEAFAPVEVFTYNARDGLQIEAVVTGAPGDGEPARPLILMPHGGPASRDALGFDWMAQFLASRGYTVLQPNFRGSTGYGREFLEAGYGEWGGKMQDDLTDGVRALAATGKIDPDRVCIIGASYGGYAALMGGATTPELYRCVVAIAPVTDTERMLREELRTGGKDSPALRYWKEQLGVETIRDDLLESNSPVNLAANFDDPVLLLHGDDDTIVPIKHSIEMDKALERAGKPVRFVRLKDEDHWLSLPETRIQMLREMDAFLAEHLPVTQ